MQRCVVLPITTAKCVANSTRCSRAGQCASHAVPYVPGRPVEDYTARNGWHSQACQGFIALDAARAPEAPPRVHQPVKGL